MVRYIKIRLQKCREAIREDATIIDCIIYEWEHLIYLIKK